MAKLEVRPKDCKSRTFPLRKIPAKTSKRSDTHNSVIVAIVTHQAALNSARPEDIVVKLGPVKNTWIPKVREKHGPGMNAPVISIDRVPILYFAELAAHLAVDRGRNLHSRIHGKSDLVRL